MAFEFRWGCFEAVSQKHLYWEICLLLFFKKGSYSSFSLEAVEVENTAPYPCCISEPLLHAEEHWETPRYTTQPLPRFLNGQQKHTSLGNVTISKLTTKISRKKYINIELSKGEKIIIYNHATCKHLTLLAFIISIFSGKFSTTCHRI